MPCSWNCSAASAAMRVGLGADARAMVPIGFLVASESAIVSTRQETDRFLNDTRGGLDEKGAWCATRSSPTRSRRTRQLVRDVYEELARSVSPTGFHYGTFKLEDGVSFVHIAVAGGRAEPARRRRGVPALPGEHPRPLRRAARSSPSWTRSARSAFRRRLVHGGTGTKDDPWQLKTPPLTSEYEMYLDERDGTKVIVCVVGKTTLLYDARAIDDLHAMLVDPRRLDRPRQRRRAEAGEGGHGRGLGPLARQPARRLVRAQEGPARAVRDVHAAAARGARPGGGRAQPAQQPDAGEVRPRPGSTRPRPSPSYTACSVS